MSSVCCSQAALAFFRAFLRRIKSWILHVVKQQLQDKGGVLVKASARIIWSTLRPIHECLSAQVLEETVLC